MPSLVAAQAVLRNTFGFPEFRPGQADILSAVLDGRDVLAVMPTGSGKSLCYQLPALVRGGLTVVVSPLIALMRNQVAQLSQFGVAAASLNSANSAAESQRALDAVAHGALRLLYMAPERLAQSDTIALLRRAGVSLLAVDEAQCISLWGHDFRPEYLTLGDVQAAIGAPQIIALTATADAATRSDILAKLFRREPEVFVHGFDRPNLRLAIELKTSTPRRQLETLLAKHRGESGIVYCSSRKRTEELAANLSASGFHALPYHAGMEAAARARNQDAFLQEDGVVMAATVAFGMGIDKPDVRFVCHADLPSNVESYYQEIGRAGRDGLPADTLTLYGMGDIRLRRLQIEDKEAPEEQKRIERQRLSALIALCESPRCRRQTLLAYFGETIAPCGNCDLCLAPPPTADGSIEAQKILSAIARTGERYGVAHIIDIVVGSDTEKVKAAGHDRLPTFGVGRDRKRREWQSLVRHLAAAGHIAVDRAGFGSLSIAPSGRAVDKGVEPFPYRNESSAAGGKKEPPEKLTVEMLASASAGSHDREALLGQLKALRMRLSKERGVPPYVIFSDRSLIDMAARAPRNSADFAAIHGVGAAKLREFSEVFLSVIAKHAA
jgi:ATP-dependent DNA helicase RecQ